ncbi:MAG TPA: hypothetical protein PLW65_00400, partial [Pseudomonadota bacterium]|nr:hypothetical protein [Pseudomonadota bacterium]
MSRRTMKTGLGSFTAAFTLWLGLLGGCAHHFTLPMTASELAQHDSGPALVAYLSQPDASPVVCDLGTGGPHLSALDEDKTSWLLRGLLDGQIGPGVWQRCASALLRSAPAELAASLLDAVGSAHRKLLRRSELEQSPILQQRLGVLQQLYVERATGLNGHPQLDDPLFADLRHALTRNRLGPVATRLGRELLETVELDHGSWQGHVVDGSLIDSRFAAGDEKTLQLFQSRLPQPSLRSQSRRRLIRLHIAASPFAEVREHAESVEELVVQQGVYRLSPAAYPPRRGWLDLTRVPMRGVLVRQHLGEQTATLLGYSEDRPRLSVLPELPLRGALLMELEGISRPVTLCAPRAALDPSPCIAVEDVKLENPVAYLDQDSAFHFVEVLPMRDAVNLAQLRDRVRLPVRVGGKPLLTFDWRLSYERPGDLLFSGAQPQGRGPSLEVDVDHRDPARFIFSVSAPRGLLLAAVEQQDLLDFHIVSRGGRGVSGSTGWSGSTGSSGSECQSGGPGADGRPACDGGPG